MTGRTKLYIGLVVLGMALIIAGLWFILNPSVVVKIPEVEPVIAMENTFTMAGIRNKLFIYRDGTVIYVEEEGLRPGGTRNRTWSKGRIDKQELDTIITFIRDSGFAGLENSYYRQESPESDLHHTITVSYQGIYKTVTTSGYFPPDSSQPYEKLPSPLDEIYIKLMDIAINRTKGVYQETF